jgi:hypothetical protein
MLDLGIPMLGLGIPMLGLGIPMLDFWVYRCSILGIPMFVLGNTRGCNDIQSQFDYGQWAL